jgi:hypothetical protein
MTFECLRNSYVLAVVLLAVPFLCCGIAAVFFHYLTSKREARGYFSLID